MKRTLLFLGADHAGFALKEAIKSRLIMDPSLDVHDLSPKFADGDDYPKHGKRVAAAVAKTAGSRGVLVCGSGVGVSIAANRIKKVRAFDAHSTDEIKLAREHNDVNVISLSGWKMKPNTALALINTFLATPFSKEQRHHRRVKQLG